MMTLQEMYQLANKRGICIDCFPLFAVKSLSLMDSDGHCYIAVDPLQLASETDELVTLGHEMGHCETGAFYNRYSQCNDIGQQEYRANKWAAKKLLPQSKLCQAFEQGLREPWELAEYFGLPESFVRKALVVYGYREAEYN